MAASAGHVRPAGRAAPVAPRARVELRVRPAGLCEREQVDARRDPRAAVDDDLVRGGDLRRGLAGLGVEPVHGPGDPAGDRVDRLDLAAVALRGARVDDDQPGLAESRRELLRVDRVALAHPRDELARLDLLLAAAHRPEPRVETAAQHRDVLVAVVAEEPPQPCRAARGAVVIGDDEDALADPGAPGGCRERRRPAAAGAAPGPRSTGRTARRRGTPRRERATRDRGPDPPPTRSSEYAQSTNRYSISRTLRGARTAPRAPRRTSSGSTSAPTDAQQLARRGQLGAVDVALRIPELRAQERLRAVRVRLLDLDQQAELR